MFTVLDFPRSVCKFKRKSEEKVYVCDKDIIIKISPKAAQVIEHHKLQVFYKQEIVGPRLSIRFFQYK